MLIGMVLGFIIFSLLIMAYTNSETANIYFKAFWIFVVIITAAFVGMLVDSALGFDGNLSIVWAIGAATMFLIPKNKDK